MCMCVGVKVCMHVLRRPTYGEESLPGIPVLSFQAHKKVKLLSTQVCFISSFLLITNVRICSVCFWVVDSVRVSLCISKSQ